jgi:thiol-disulfide isomerase/thioredoxin
MSKKTQNLINLIIVIIVIALVCGGIYYFINKNNNVTQYTNVDYISIDKLKEKINNKESFILVISKDDCSHCKAYLPVVNKIGKQYNVTFYDVSQTNLSDENLTYLRNVANISGTPTTVFIQDGEEKTTTNRLVGEVPEYRVIEKLKAMGYINE